MDAKKESAPILKLISSKENTSNDPNIVQILLKTYIIVNISYQCIKVYNHIHCWKIQTEQNRYVGISD